MIWGSDTTFWSCPQNIDPFGTTAAHWWRPWNVLWLLPSPISDIHETLFLLPPLQLKLAFTASYVGMLILSNAHYFGVSVTSHQITLLVLLLILILGCWKQLYISVLFTLIIVLRINRYNFKTLNFKPVLSVFPSNPRDKIPLKSAFNQGLV